ncbi:hypothetical protein FA15DRAFT_607232 [Coprinopsis marcescibilis]|uniref:DEAD/DEAH-box helicase domain-containing protein n=1 Tax=Coprinopsis marcescibilis TaxID=230819 RepID=A0A5C3K9H2_COPMA|nr:hypothetical protein FA15DRAFT_607232 [Coprinopsis marcescibilis]
MYAQVEIIQKLVQGKDIVACLPTGAGKTLTFWMPVLMAIQDGHEKGMTFVVTPLNLLGRQNEDQLNKAGIAAISVSAENATEETCKASLSG